MQAANRAPTAKPHFSGHGSEEARIRDLTDRYMELWSNHRIAEQSQMLTENADLVNVLGELFQGRSAIHQLHTQLHRTIFANSRSRILELRIKLLDDSVAVVLARWEMVGAAKVSGWNVPDTRTGWMTLVWVKLDGEWLITSLQNTDTLPAPALPLT